MEHIHIEVNDLSRLMLERGILFTDKLILRRVIELREYFSQDVINIVVERINDERTNAQIKAILEAEMQKSKIHFQA